MQKAMRPCRAGFRVLRALINCAERVLVEGFSPRQGGGNWRNLLESLTVWSGAAIRKLQLFLSFSPKIEQE